MRTGRRLCAVALVAALVSGSMRGEPLAVAEETSPANVAAARRHFDRARTYYAQGAYREAISEFEAAHALDPNAKDLVFNLGVVHEKLGDIDDALKWFRLYASMNITDQEREKANSYLRRLEGAKKEVEAKQAAAAAAASSSAGATQPPPPTDEKPKNGRIDGFTIAAASVAVVGLGTGIALGIKALSDKPPANAVLGQNLSYNQLVSRTNQAHYEAIGADVAFGVAVAAAAVTAYLYLARPRSTAPSTTGATTVSAAPLTGGGAFFVQGSF